jgi:hypothetical protein
MILVGAFRGFVSLKATRNSVFTYIKKHFDRFRRSWPSYMTETTLQSGPRRHGLFRVLLRDDVNFQYAWNIKLRMFRTDFMQAKRPTGIYVTPKRTLQNLYICLDLQYST